MPGKKHFNECTQFLGNMKKGKLTGSIFSINTCNNFFNDAIMRRIKSNEIFDS